jgi:hypothetical protein
MKKLMIILTAICLISLITAGTISLSNWEQETKLNKDQLDQLKLSTNKQSFDIKISEIECNKEECYAKISQEEVLNIEWRRNKFYKDCEKVGFDIVCSELKEYTNEQNLQAVKDYIDERLGKYSDAEIKRKNVKIDVGEIIK